MLEPQQKIKVFISSICGVSKYDTLRAKLKDQIEQTKLADAYLFEATEASTLTAEQHYLWDLETSDVCIFLIDNADGVNPGVQREVDAAKKYNKKSLYYFCDENSKEMTALQKSLMGAKYAKSRIVHTFDELLEHSGQGFIDDITLIYKYYCTGHISAQTSAEQVNVSEDICDSSLLVEKNMLANTDKSKLYFYHMFCSFKKEAQGTSDFDTWCAQFLLILFEHHSIREFNVGMFLDELKKHQSAEHFEVVSKRWQAIQFYFNNNLSECVASLEEALSKAKEKNLSEWLIKDILIDLRNQRGELYETENKYCYDDAAQQELSQSKHSIYYPVIDRIQGDLYEKITKDIVKKKYESPYTVELGNNITQTDLISNCYITAMFNGSLTYLHLLHNDLKHLAFWLCNNYTDWKFRKVLLKESIFTNSSKEIKSLERAFPDIITKLNNDDAMEIFDYCNNQVIQHKRFRMELQALSVIGYYLSDHSFDVILANMLSKIDDWLNADEPVFSIGEHIFTCLQGIGHRINPELIVEICCKFMDKGFSRWYSNAFKLLRSKIDISTISKDKAVVLIKHIICILNSDNRDYPELTSLLITLRKQSKELTEELNAVIADKLPDFYKGVYALETENESAVDVRFIEKYIEQIKSHNESQGKNGVYHGYASHPHETIRNIIQLTDTLLQENMVDNILSASYETILLDNQSIEVKCSAFDLIICVFQKYPDSPLRNTNIVEGIKQNYSSIENCSRILFDSNLSIEALKFVYHLCVGYTDCDNYIRLFEVLPYVQEDEVTQIRICETIVNYLDNDIEKILPNNLESIILQNTLTWLGDDSLNLRWYCVRILFALLRNEELCNIISYQMITLIEKDSPIIKNLIQRNAANSNLDKSTKEYILQKCNSDGNYVVRKVSQELNSEK